MANNRRRHEEYHVGWVCAVPVEFTAAKLSLDEEHEPLNAPATDSNIYALGRICGHNVVIACLPAGNTGTNTAAAVAIQMRSTFSSIQFSLMVGIAGGVPSNEADIRLGDIVVSQPKNGHGGVVQYDFGKTKPGGFQQTGFLTSPPNILLGAVSTIQANHLHQPKGLLKHLLKLTETHAFSREQAGPDVLYQASYQHEDGPTCARCKQEKIVQRKPRSEDIAVYYGTIASGNQVMRDGVTRDHLSAQFGGVLCFEMEAAGLMNSFPCLIIRGICDYADSHKNKKWQPYAGATAAAYAKELLSVIPPAAAATASTAGMIPARYVTFGPNNSGFQLGVNEGSISGFQFGSRAK